MSIPVIATRWLAMAGSYLSVVPANAGTHNHREQYSCALIVPSCFNNNGRGVWVPAFAGTTWREGRPHSSRAFENANDDTRRVFSSRISVRVIGGSARWLQFSRSHSRQLTPIGVPSVFSRSMPAA